MTEQKAEGCGCGSDCKAKSSRLLLNFFLIIIIIILSGILYSLQGLMAMCPAMNGSQGSQYMMKGKVGMCPIMNKGTVQAER